MGFVRMKSGVFNGLKDYSKARPIKIFNREIIYPVQETLPEIGFDYSSGMRVRSGKFFEVLSQGIYGGRFKERLEINEKGGRDSIIEPDLFYQYKSIYIFKEIKSFSPDNTLKLFDEQMNKYAIQQFESIEIDGVEILPTINFDLFRHRIKNLDKSYKQTDLEELIRNLSHNIGFMISIPFSVAYAIYDNASIPYDINPSPFPFTSRYEGKAYSWCTQFRPRGINNLLAYPEKTFEKLGLNPLDFDFIKSKFPKGVKMNGNRVTPFPILIVRERYPDTELRNLEDRVKERWKRMDANHPGYKDSFLGGTERNGEVEKMNVEPFISGWNF